jgi:hypothetical protein
MVLPTKREGHNPQQPQVLQPQGPHTLAGEEELTFYTIKRLIGLQESLTFLKRVYHA